MKPAPPVTTVFTESPPGLTLPVGARLDASTTGVPSPRTYAQLDDATRRSARRACMRFHGARGGATRGSEAAAESRKCFAEVAERQRRRLRARPLLFVDTKPGVNADV